jgi:WD40 repeat protein
MNALCPFVLLLSVGPARIDPARDVEIARLIDQLGAETFEERQQATRWLEAIGQPALPALRRAAESADPEVRRRAADVIRAIENHRTGGLRRILSVPGDGVSEVAVSADGKIALSHSGTDLRVWDLDTGKQISRLQGNFLPGTRMALAPDGGSAVADRFGTDDVVLACWDTTTGMERRLLDAAARDVTGIAFTPDGKALLVGSGNGSVQLRSAEEHKRLRLLKERDEEERVLGVAVSRDGRYGLSGDEHGTLRLWDLGTGKEKARTALQVERLRAVALGPDRSVAACLASDGVLRLWDTTADTERHLVDQETVIRCFAFEPDGRRIATGGDDGILRLWDVATGKEVARLEGHRGRVTAVRWAAGRRLVSCGRDGTVRVWEAPLRDAPGPGGTDR